MWFTGQVVTEVCVKFAALGLLREARQERVEIVTDAKSAALNEEKGALNVLAEFSGREAGHPDPRGSMIYARREHHDQSGYRAGTDTVASA